MYSFCSCCGSGSRLGKLQQLHKLQTSQKVKKLQALHSKAWTFGDVLHIPYARLRIRTPTNASRYTSCNIKGQCCECKCCSLIGVCNCGTLCNSGIRCYRLSSTTCTSVYPSGSGSGSGRLEYKTRCASAVG